MRKQIAVTKGRAGELVQAEYTNGPAILFRRIKTVGRKWEYVQEYRAFTPMDGIWLVSHNGDRSTMILPWGEARDVDCGRYADLYAKFSEGLNVAISNYTREPHSTQGITELVLKTIARKVK